MKYDELVRAGRIRRERVSAAEIRQALDRAERDLKLASKILAEGYRLGLRCGLQCGAASRQGFMFAQGFRPASAEGHKNTFAFLRVALGKEQGDLVTYFDRMRNKRNQAIYGMAGLLAETEARDLLSKASQFVRLVRTLLKRAP